VPEEAREAQHESAAARQLAESAEVKVELVSVIALLEAGARLAETGLASVARRVLTAVVRLLAGAPPVAVLLMAVVVIARGMA